MLRLKQELQLQYERARPELREIIPEILKQEEKNAWNLSLFPTLLLPGLVEERIATLHFDAAQEPAIRATPREFKIANPSSFIFPEIFEELDRMIHFSKPVREYGCC